MQTFKPEKYFFLVFKTQLCINFLCLPMQSPFTYDKKIKI